MAMKIYTRGGDTGETGTLGPERVPKDDPRMVACGDVDELNAAIGCAMAGNISPEVAVVLKRVQNELFHLGMELAKTTRDGQELACPLTLEHVGRLEVDIDRLSRHLEELSEFILPGGDACAAQLHLARTVCRRAERSIVGLHRRNPLPAACLGYINRLSDLLFIMARYQNRHSGKHEDVWQK
jgi:cob(I)alamin adenosyltransferase